jgi:hypothetical protein
MARVNRDEIWVPIAGYDGRYEVSDLGRVRRTADGYILKDQPWGNDGYRKVTLSAKNKSKSFLVHRLVACHFIPADPVRPLVNHKDGSRTNNAVENLEWCTQSENLLHASRLGRMTHNRGERCGTAKLTEDDVRWIRVWLGEGFSQQRIADAFGISQSQVTRINRGLDWKHLEGPWLA